MTPPPERNDLAPAARLFGRLLVREIDAATLAELRQPEIAAVLAAVGVEVPADAELPSLANEWLERFLHPRGASPPVHSLFRDGHYNGDAAVAIGEIARAAGLELAVGARNAPPDHIGCILLLWAELAEARPELAALLAEHHLTWSERPLLSTAARGGFYGAVAHATVALVRELTGSDPHEPPHASLSEEP